MRSDNPSKYGERKSKLSTLPDADNPLEMATVRQEGNKAYNVIQGFAYFILTNYVLVEEL